MQAFHGNSESKEQLIGIMEDFSKDHEWRQRMFYDEPSKSEDGKARACFIGCAVAMQSDIDVDQVKRSGWEGKFQQMYGIPAKLAGVFEIVFDQVSEERSKTIWKDFLFPIEPGVDLTGIAQEFEEWRFTRPGKHRSVPQDQYNEVMVQKLREMIQKRSCAYIASQQEPVTTK